MTKQVHLIHSVHKSRLETALRDGLKAASESDDLGLDMRRGVVYCWLRKEDDKMSAGGQRPDYVHLQVTVDKSRCTVADMEYSSLALMYRQGHPTKPKNERASALFAEIYQVTSVPLSDYQPGIFFTPEVLVKGDIAPECLRVLADQASGRGA